MTLLEQSCHTAIREQSEQFYRRRKLVRVHVDIPLRDLNAGMTRKSGKQTHINALVCQSGYERAPPRMAAGTCQSTLGIDVEEKLAHGVG